MPVHVARAGDDYLLGWLLCETFITTKTKTTSGNAGLMMMG